MASLWPSFSQWHWPSGALVLTLALLVVVGCSSDRLTEVPNTGLSGQVGTAASVDCSAGCKDNFTDADGTVLESHTPDVGGFTWQKVTSFNTYSAVIKGNAVGVEHTEIDDKQWLYVVPEITGLDNVQLEVRVDSASEGGVIRVFVQLRSSGSFPSGYQAFLYLRPAQQLASVEFARNNQSFPLSNPPKAIPWPGTGIVKFRAEAVGGSLREYINDSLVYSVTDPSPLPAGFPGIGYSTNIFPDPPDVWITSFEVKPCPPSGDPRIDPLEVRKVLLQSLSNSLPNSPPQTAAETGARWRYLSECRWNLWRS
jgi:hypothetical protein